MTVAVAPLQSHLPPGLIVSAPSSGAGKTTITLGVARALTRRGLAVQAFKCGPDYIDPAFHRAATGRASFSLDSWSMSHDMLVSLIERSRGADIVVAEGAMGLFDGVAHAGACGNGSSADIAAFAGWPVVLVLDCTSQAQTAAAVALGLAQFRQGVRLGGVILNRIASPRHADLVRAGFAGTGLPILGTLPRQAEIAMPERHLGLVQAGETAALDEKLDAMAQLASEHIDLDAIVRVAAGTALPQRSRRSYPMRPPGQRIALAQDATFSFVYPHLIEDWRSAGAELVAFSPLADEAPDPTADVVWLPGGYPELHAGRIAGARRFLDGLRAFARGRPVHGECGGYMVLGEALIDQDGTAHAMAGLLGLVTSYEQRRLHLGYRTADLVRPMPGYAAGSRLRGHEFHYSTVIAQPDEPLAHVADAAGGTIAETGSRRGNVTGSYFHLVAERT
jgi:cobyrinic acid a,c-diamide synthase